MASKNTDAAKRERAERVAKAKKEFAEKQRGNPELNAPLRRPTTALSNGPSRPRAQSKNMRPGSAPLKSEDSSMPPSNQSNDDFGNDLSEASPDDAHSLEGSDSLLGENTTSDQVPTPSTSPKAPPKTAAGKPLGKGDPVRPSDLPPAIPQIKNSNNFIYDHEPSSSPGSTPGSSPHLTKKNPPSPLVGDRLRVSSEGPDKWEVSRDSCKFTGKELGVGFFGQVLEARLKGADGMEQLVAVKVLKEGASRELERSFRAECDIMKQLQASPHENVLSLIGYSFSRPMLIVVEFCGLGDLLSLLHKSRQDESLNLQMKVSYAVQVARGMAHLAAKGLVHRDLACRNVLVNFQQICKISDFGLSRDLGESNGIYCKNTPGKLPFKWMALESLTLGVNTTQSDVWSFGVLLWEIMTSGERPYPTIPNADIPDFLKAGNRLTQPSTCPDDMYTIMCTCWQEKPDARPSFAELTEKLQLYKAKSKKDPSKKKGLLDRLIGKVKSKSKQKHSLDANQRSEVMNLVKEAQMTVEDAHELVSMYDEGLLKCTPASTINEIVLTYRTRAPSLRADLSRAELARGDTIDEENPRASSDMTDA